MNNLRVDFNRTIPVSKNVKNYKKTFSLSKGYQVQLRVERIHKLKPHLLRLNISLVF